MLDAVTALHAWQPPEGELNPVFDYPERISRYRDRGILTETDADTLHHLLASWSGRWEINHGDPLPCNFLLTEGGNAALLDWEFTYLGNRVDLTVLLGHSRAVRPALLVTTT